MRVLFIDFDGVLHPLGLLQEPGRFVNGKPVVKPIPVDYFCWLPILKELTNDHPDVMFVLHTSWRASHTLEALKDYFGDLQNRVLDVTDANLPKLESIHAWLAQHPEVRAWRVLDDAELEFQLRAREDWEDLAEVLAEELILCHYQRGISEPRVQEELLAWLQATE